MAIFQLFHPLLLSALVHYCSPWYPEVSSTKCLDSGRHLHHLCPYCVPGNTLIQSNPALIDWNTENRFSKPIKRKPAEDDTHMSTILKTAVSFGFLWCQIFDKLRISPASYWPFWGTNLWSPFDLQFKLRTWNLFFFSFFHRISILKLSCTII